MVEVLTKVSIYFESFTFINKENEEGSIPTPITALPIKKKLKLP